MKRSKAQRKRSQKETKPSAQAKTWSQDLDTGVLISGMMLVSIGVVMNYSTTAALALERQLPPLFISHIGALLLGTCVAYMTYSMPLEFWRRLALPLWLVSVSLLAAVELAGVEVNGAQRWLGVPGLGIRFQPVEICKFTTVIMVAVLIAHRDGHEEVSLRRTISAGALALPPIGLLLLQPDLGNAILLATLVALLLIVAGTRLTRLIGPAIIGIAAVALYISQNSYALRRITGFIDPWATYRAEGFQLVQSFVAFGRGGVFGVGLGNGQQKLAYLPEAHTDFILALVAEELGLLGILVVLASFAGLMLGGTRVARGKTDRFALLLTFGMTTLLTIPAVINAAVVMGLLPTKGLTLPFLSYGRTSLIMNCAAFGLLLGLARPEKPRSKEPGARAWP
ncbi:MAG: stage V sporulation protein E [Deltaproteobacteria bacterium]|nr:stage V sporulation protein E [Deltaproteobacteria bacterium]